MKPRIRWNNQVKIIFSDVDDTVAEVYTPAEPAMIHELERILQKNIPIVFISGQSIAGMKERFIDAIAPKLRKNILAAHCSGAEVWGFDNDGNVLAKAYYSLYDEKLSEEEKKKFREVIQQLITEFHLKPYPPIGSREKFGEITQHDPYAIMLSDRGSQITLQLTNAHNLTVEQAEKLNIPLLHGKYDWRHVIAKRGNELLKKYAISITGRVVSITAIDFALKDVSKTTAIDWILKNNTIISSFNLDSKELFHHPESMEIWGDKFSAIHGGTDRFICEALPKEVRAIDFREENSEEFLLGYNIQLWNGQKHLHHGLLEYLQSKHE